jgi:hypothetical protein
MESNDAAKYICQMVESQVIECIPGSAKKIHVTLTEYSTDNDNDDNDSNKTEDAPDLFCGDLM